MSDVTAVGAADQTRDAEGFLDKVEHALADLTEIMVVTAVGDVKVTIQSSARSSETTIDKTTIVGNSIVTIVKLLDGDVTTVIAEPLRADAELRALHTTQVTESLKVIPEHLRSLVEMARELLR
jgi:hypothetical protein